MKFIIYTVTLKCICKDSHTDVLMVVHSFAHMYLTSLYLTFLKFYQVLPLHMHSRSQGVEPSNIACDAGAAGPAEANVH